MRLPFPTKMQNDEDYGFAIFLENNSIKFHLSHGKVGGKRFLGKEKV